jgi:hypothetical protein
MMLGVPNLLKGGIKGTAATLLSNAVGKLFDFLFPPPKWGVYLPGTAKKAINVSSVIAMDINSAADVSDYLIEKGSFVSYNKVVLPDVFQFRIVQDGREAGRTKLLDWLQRSKDGLDVFDVVCPEFVYPNATLIRYSIRRSAEHGASMVTADCIFQQIREKPAKYSSSQTAKPENKKSTPVVQVNPVVSKVIKAIDFGPL